MSKLAGEIRECATAIEAASGDKRTEEERTLLRLLGSLMKHEESCFDAAHGFARILDATDTHGEVRLGVDGEWKIGGATAESLVETWSDPGRPTLQALLTGVQRSFASAKVGTVVAEILEIVGASLQEVHARA